MARITNPNDIVDEYVDDLRRGVGENLVSVFMYGSAVTHEFRPGVSLVRTGVVLTDASIAALEPLAGLHRKWARWGMATPLFFPLDALGGAARTFPVEFYEMQSNYRVLCGTDVLRDLQIRKGDLALQCARELRLISMELREDYVKTGGRGDGEAMPGSLQERLVPLFRALLALDGRAVPSITSDMVGNVEDLYGLGLSVFARLFGAPEGTAGRERPLEFYGQLLAALDTIAAALDVQGYC